LREKTESIKKVKKKEKKERKKERRRIFEMRNDLLVVVVSF